MKMMIPQEDLPFIDPLTISGYTFDRTAFVVVELSDGDYRGRSQSSSVYYLNDNPSGICDCNRQIVCIIEDRVTRDDLRQLLPPGGAPNAIDCALSDFQARVENIPVRRRSGFDAPQRITPKTLGPLVSSLADCPIGLLEQPFARGYKAHMEDLSLPLLTADDKSCLHLGGLESNVDRFDDINIKLDKFGGLTEDLMMVEKARNLGLKPTVGNVMGSSIAMAPAFILGQFCDVVDIDSPIFLRADRLPAVDY